MSQYFFLITAVPYLPHNASGKPAVTYVDCVQICTCS